MASTRRGFNRERHTPLKLAFAVLAIAGFALAWAGFARSHPPAGPELPLNTTDSAVLQVPTSTPTATRTPAEPSGTPATSPPATPTPTPGSAVDATATPGPQRSANRSTQRRSRGS